MVDPHVALLSAIVFIPALGALVLAFVPSGKLDAIRSISFAATVLVVLAAVYGFFSGAETRFDAAADSMQSAFDLPWIPSFDINYFMGVDGISLPLVMLTAVISMLAMGASWSIGKHVKAYCILFLLLETGMLGVFLALDFFLFYVFWEVMLLPMYFLIGVWGGPRKEYAAIKFFLYTLLGSVLMLIAILILYFHSDLRELAKVSDWNGDNGRVVVEWSRLHVGAGAEARLRAGGDEPIHTFNLLALAAMGRHTDVFSPRLQWWVFLLLFVGFIIKVPSVPLHTWLPDAHVEAPTPISMILAGILLKMGGYGIIRICYPICPHGGYELAYFVCLVGVVSMVYGAFAALAQSDFKRLVAYSSVSHMGYVVLGLGVWSARAALNYEPDFWKMGVDGAMFQMIAHGISSAGMFFMVGVIYDRVHHRDLGRFGGLFGKMPAYTGLSIGIFFAALGLPGLCGFIGEVLVILSVWSYSSALAVVAASVMIITAGYILWTIQRVYLGPEYKGPHEEGITPITRREFSIAATLFVLAIVLGVFPQQTVLKYMDRTVDRQVNELADWTKQVKEAPAAAGRPAARGEPAAAAVFRGSRRGGAAPAASDQRPAASPEPAASLRQRARAASFEYSSSLLSQRR